MEAGGHIQKEGMISSKPVFECPSNILNQTSLKQNMIIIWIITKDLNFCAFESLVGIDLILKSEFFILDSFIIIQEPDFFETASTFNAGYAAALSVFLICDVMQA